MVSYQTYTAIAFEIANEKGAQFDGIQDGGQFISQLAQYWRQNKENLKQMTEQQARRQLQSVVSA